jgi:hypothetical protein
VAQAAAVIAARVVNTAVAAVAAGAVAAVVVTVINFLKQVSTSGVLKRNAAQFILLRRFFDSL